MPEKLIVVYKPLSELSSNESTEKIIAYAEFLRMCNQSVEEIVIKLKSAKNGTASPL